MINFIHNDGGRSKYFNGGSGDCVVRAIAIAAELPYAEVYDQLWISNKVYVQHHRDVVAKNLEKSGCSPRNKNYKKVYSSYLNLLGFVWVPCMKIGSGCKVHLKADELPSGRIICAVSKHLVAVIDGIINDTHDCSRGGQRCVYGYYYRRPNTI